MVLNLTRSQISEITGLNDLIKLDKGESTDKYTAQIDGNKVIIRNFEKYDQYKRFEREGAFLRYLKKVSKHAEEFDSKNFGLVRFPNIIQEYPKEKIRILSWVEGMSANNLISDKLISIYKIETNERISKFFNFFNLKMNKSSSQDLDRFNLINTHLNILDPKNNDLPIKYKKRYGELYFKLKSGLDSLSTSYLKPNSIYNAYIQHGDFINDNIILNEKKEIVGIIDWEFACLGPIYYDRLYYSIYHGVAHDDIKFEGKDQIVNLINLFLIRWYIVFDSSVNKKYLQKFGFE